MTFYTRNSTGKRHVLSAGFVLVTLSTLLGGASTFLHVLGSDTDGSEAYGFGYTASLALMSMLVHLFTQRKTLGKAEAGPNTVRYQSVYVVLAIGFYVVGHVVLFRAAALITPSELAVAGRSYLVFAFVLALLFTNQMMDVNKLACIVAFSCFILMTSSETLEINRHGMFFALATYASFAIYNFILSRVSLVHANLFNAIAAACTAGYLAWEMDFKIDLTTLSEFALISASCYALSHALFYKSLHYNDFLNLSFVRSMSPLVVLVLAWTLGYRPPTLLEFLAIIGAISLQFLWDHQKKT